MENFNSNYPPPEPKKNNTGIIIAVVALLLCCCCLVMGGFGYWLWQNGDQMLGTGSLLPILGMI
jgi:hypothetical protein